MNNTRNMKDRTVDKIDNCSLEVKPPRMIQYNYSVGTDFDYEGPKLQQVGETLFC